MTAPDLLACPFCGEKPRVHHFRGCEIACPNADCPSEPTVWQWDEAEAIAAWNTRATPAAMDVPFTTCDTHVAVIGTGQHSFVAEPVFTVSDALDVPKVKALVEAAKPFADIGVGSDPDYQAVVRIDRDAVIALRAALDALREGGDNG